MFLCDMIHNINVDFIYCNCVNIIEESSLYKKRILLFLERTFDIQPNNGRTRTIFPMIDHHLYF